MGSPTYLLVVSLLVASASAAGWHTTSPESSRWWSSSCTISVREDLTPSDFLKDFYLRRPVLLRGGKRGLNAAAQDMVKDADQFLSEYGKLTVKIGDAWDLAVHGTASKSTTLGDYVASWHEKNATGTQCSPDSDPSKKTEETGASSTKRCAAPPRTHYFFDANGKFLDGIPKLRDAVSTPEMLRAGKLSERVERPLILSLGPEGTGIAWHLHRDAWNQLLVGEKRWFLMSPRSFHEVYHPGRPHTTWIDEAYHAGMPGLIECVQRPGDVVYVPEHWWHATVNLADTVSISRQAQKAPVPAGCVECKSPRRHQQRWQDAFRRRDFVAAIKAARRFVSDAPHDADAHLALGISRMQKGDVDCAIRSLERAIHANSQNPGPYLTLAQVIVRPGRKKQYDGLANKTLQEGKRLALQAKDRGHPFVQAFETLTKQLELN